MKYDNEKWSFLVRNILRKINLLLKFSDHGGQFTKAVPKVTQTSYRQTRNTIRINLDQNPYKEQQNHRLL